jgi:hypothetical protein
MEVVLPSGKEPPVLIGYAGWAPEPIWEDEKIFLLLPGIEPRFLGRPAWLTY